jgi:large subunit ribosomal protein L13
MKDMNKAFILRPEDRAPEWHVLDAKGQTLGRLATQIATLLRGRHKPSFTHHTDSGDYVVVLNCADIAVTGDKLEGKEYITVSGWRGGKRVTALKDMLAKKPTEVVRLAVKGMLPRNTLSRQILSKLKVYAGGEHPHVAQVR